ncbi:Neutral metalloproteinase [Rhodanobacter sp. Root179]|uniref:M4 family metallopeptidase n=1 Tax=Rhodanobacter sp. Root179 TaxID=1736482 RepID=UPI000A754343|nr:M4 family metallopeptidase [Rhodanobacter sp. Root179]
MILNYKTLPLAVLLAFGANQACAVETNPAAVSRALELIRSHGATTRAAAGDHYVSRGVITDANGTEHVRLDRTYKGLPVIGGDLVVHSRNGSYQSASLTQGAALNLSVQPVIGADEAAVIAGTEFGSAFAGMPERTLSIYARGHGAARLVWRIRMHNAQADTTYIVDARSGAIVEHWSNLETAAVTGQAKTLYSGTVPLVTNSVIGGYELRDPNRGRMRTIDGSNSRTSGQIYKDSDNVWGNSTTLDLATAAADAEYGASMTWDFYKTAFGRNGIGDDGKGAYNRVHYGTKYNNAFWSDACFCMTYGDGDGINVGPLVALDITGHEMSHGVTARTAGLIYSGESGGLNEANSDILGTMVEFYANNSHDTPDYMIGESIVPANVPGSPSQHALRYMWKPSLDGRSPDFYVSNIGSLDVHYSSGVANHFYYLLAEGTTPKTFSGVVHSSPTFNGASLPGIGRAKAQKIWYRALTVYFTSSTDYAAARVATIQAAKDLYGTTSAEANAVAATWTAVHVL